MRAARAFDMPFSFSASYCFSFFTLGRLSGTTHSFRSTREVFPEGGESETASANLGKQMESLTQMKCVACRRDEPTVTDAEIEELHPQIPDWELVEVDGIKRLRRVFPAEDFVQALGFTNKVAELAENEGHHPALLTEWGRTTVTWWTHKIRGLHRNDFIMAAKTDELSRS
jgi:4a-hydroxytetrahydrobiopterin dehydratase